MQSLAIIMARGGSKRIPRKNIREFMGKPMIAYAIKAVSDAGVFSEVMVSTDDEEIAAVALANGAEVPFMRSAETAGDMATTSAAALEVLREYKDRGVEFVNLAVVYPCVPLLTGKVLADAWRTFEESNADALLPVVRYHFPVQRAMVATKGCFLAYREPENASRRTQDLEPAYHDAGMFCFARIDAFQRCGVLVSERTIMYEMPSNIVQDIDTLDDWHAAEIKYRTLRDA